MVEGPVRLRLRANPPTGARERALSTRSIIAFYPALAKAEWAERDLVAAGIAAHDIALAARAAAFGETAIAVDRADDADEQEQRYFDWLVGAHVPAMRVGRYHVLLAEGAALICIRAADDAADEVRRILRRHFPLDLGGAAASSADPAHAGAKPGSGGTHDLDEFLLGVREEEV